MPVVEACENEVLWIEIAFRMRLLKCFNYWCGTEAYWNWFDMLLAATGFADIMLQPRGLRGSFISFGCRPLVG